MRYIRFTGTLKSPKCDPKTREMYTDLFPDDVWSEVESGSTATCLLRALCMVPMHRSMLCLIFLKATPNEFPEFLDLTMNTRTRITSDEMLEFLEDDRGQYTEKVFTLVICCGLLDTRSFHQDPTHGAVLHSARARRSNLLGKAKQIHLVRDFHDGESKICSDNTTSQNWSTCRSAAKLLFAGLGPGHLASIL